ncbi:hypothetical protein F5B20DRAFT_50641 [Whalleya microplaca]|nr:hypothetical protein F5B20DRAFT_50641 [Whalleya microplaca]
MATSTDNNNYQAVILNYEILQLRETYLESKALADLDNLIQATRLALHGLLEEHPSRAAHFHELGIALYKRYETTEATEDLGEAIRVERLAVNSSPIDSPQRPSYLNRLAANLREKYSLTEDSTVLEEAIILARQWNLGTLLSIGYCSRTAAIDDFEEASQHLQDAIAMAPDSQSGQPIWLAHLADGYGEKYLRTKQLVCLNQAIQVGREFLAVTLGDDSNRIKRLSNLADRLHEKRYFEEREVADIDHAIQVKGEAPRYIWHSKPTAKVWGRAGPLCRMRRL